eukprot:tig00020710_g13390.t1
MALFASTALPLTAASAVVVTGTAATCPARRPRSIRASSFVPSLVPASAFAVRAQPAPVFELVCKKGFGEVKRPATPSSKEDPEFKKQAETYDEKRKEGFPEFNVYIRRKGDNPPNWYPVGSMCVQEVLAAKAVYENEEGLVKSAVKMYPKYKDVPMEEFEYGYQLKGNKDYPIDVAEKPEPKAPGVFDALKSTLSGIFKKDESA